MSEQFELVKLLSEAYRGDFYFMFDLIEEGFDIRKTLIKKLISPFLYLLTIQTPTLFEKLKNTYSSILESCSKNLKALSWENREQIIQNPEVNKVFADYRDQIIIELKVCVEKVEKELFKVIKIEHEYK